MARQVRYPERLQFYAPEGTVMRLKAIAQPDETWQDVARRVLDVRLGVVVAEDEYEARE